MRATTEAYLGSYALGVRHQFPDGHRPDGRRHAISVETGRTLWIHEQRAATMSFVATGGGRVIGGDVNGRLWALDQETGEVLWERNIGSRSGAAGPVAPVQRVPPRHRPLLGSGVGIGLPPEPCRSQSSVLSSAGCHSEASSDFTRGPKVLLNPSSVDLIHSI